MKREKIKAGKRTVKGRSVKALRREGILPANIYGKKVKSRMVELNLSEFEALYQKAGETTLIDLNLGTEDIPVLIHNIQTNPVTDQIIHVDFLQVNLKEKVTAQVPLELVGDSPAEKQGLGTVVQHMDEVEVEALPTDLPEKFDIDISRLIEVDDSIKIKDLDVDEKKIKIGEDKDRIIVLVEALREEEEEVPAAEGEAEVTSEEEEQKGQDAEKEESPESPSKE